MVKVTTLEDGRKQFYIDVGNIPTDKVVMYLQQVMEKFKSAK